MSKASIEIVWFKRDLRVTDHKPLFEASLSQLPVLPLYVVEPGYWNRAAASARHWHFISDCLKDLNLDCRNLGQPLLIKIGEVEKVLEEIQNRFMQISRNIHIFANFSELSFSSLFQNSFRKFLRNLHLLTFT